MNKDEIIECLEMVLDGLDSTKEFFCAAWNGGEQFRMITSDGFRPLVGIVVDWVNDCIEEGRKMTEDEAMEEMLSIFKNYKKNGEEDND